MSNPVTIIMIEDDEGHARLIERNIRRSGVNNEIVPFTSGTAALNYLFGKDGTGLDHKGNALLILLDLNLPDTTGIDILKRVKDNKYLKTTPVVVLTTTDDSQEIKRCYELGCNVYITKPVNYESFANAIRPPARRCSSPSFRYRPPPHDISDADLAVYRRRRRTGAAGRPRPDAARLQLWFMPPMASTRPLATG
jgi:DNA-binding response OmpR family regulator